MGRNLQSTTDGATIKTGLEDVGQVAEGHEPLLAGALMGPIDLRHRFLDVACDDMLTFEANHPAECFAAMFAEILHRGRAQSGGQDAVEG